jgi:excisionase family DNA binding protein
MSELLSVREVALRLKKTPKTISAWITTGEIKAARAGEHGNWMVSEEALDDFLKATPAGVND